MKTLRLLGILLMAALLLSGCLDRIPDGKHAGQENSAGSPSGSAHLQPSPSGSDASGNETPTGNPGADDATTPPGGTDAPADSGDAGDGNISSGTGNGPDGSNGTGNAGDTPGTGEDESGANGGGMNGSPGTSEGDSVAVWMAVGDIMMHMPQLPAYYDKKKQTYNFNPFFDQVKPILEQGDWTMANLETPIAGKSLGYSGYPRFNAPPQLADALKYAGFDIVTNANNHALDRGAEGVSRTLHELLARGFAVTGTARSQAEADKLTIVERNGIKMGVLAYTYGTNGIPMPKDKPYAVSLIDEDAIVRDIGLLRRAGADFVTVALHFGIEYQTVPNDGQKKLARELIAAGADIIAGSHPHVIQPYETVEVQNADGTERRGLIIYSMGNFISNQRGDTKDYGIIYKVGIHKDHATGLTTIGEVEPIPTWVYRSGSEKAYKYVVVPLAQTIATRSIKELSQAGYNALSGQLNVVTKRLQSMSAAPVIVQAVP